MNAISEYKEMLRRVRLVVFDFDGVFTNNRVVVSEDGTESVVCCRSDGLGLRRLEMVNVSSFILSSEPNSAVVRRAKKLKIQCFSGVEDKLVLLKRELGKRRISPDETAFVGNDINDAECLKAVGMPVVVGDAWPEVRPLAKLILARDGGDGAVREFCDMVWLAKKARR